MKAPSILLALLITPQVFAGEFLQFHKWTDQNGVTHYSTVPRKMLTHDMKLKPEVYIDREHFADAQYSKRRESQQLERQQARAEKTAQDEFARRQRLQSEQFAAEAKLKEDIYTQSKAIVARGILGGEASYQTDADARSNELRRTGMNDRAYERNVAEEGRARHRAGQEALSNNRPDYAWHHGLQLQSLSYEIRNKNLADQFYRQGADLMASASKLLDKHHKVVNDYESGNTDDWKVSVDK